MKKLSIIYSLTLLFLFVAVPAFADTGDVTRIQNFIQNVTQVLVTLAGATATGFFVWGGFRYITSSGNPEQLDGAKKTIMYSAIGLAIALGAVVLSNIVTQIASGAFGTGQ